MWSSLTTGCYGRTAKKFLRTTLRRGPAWTKQLELWPVSHAISVQAHYFVRNKWDNIACTLSSDSHLMYITDAQTTWQRDQKDGRFGDSIQKYSHPLLTSVRSLAPTPKGYWRSCGVMIGFVQTAISFATWQQLQSWSPSVFRDCIVRFDCSPWWISWFLKQVWREYHYNWAVSGSAKHTTESEKFIEFIQFTASNTRSVC